MRTLCLSLSLLMLFSCKDQLPSDCDPEMVSTFYQEDSKIEMGVSTNSLLTFAIIDGEETVFIFERTAAQCDDIYDDEYGEFLAFAVPLDSATTSFEIRDDELLTARCHYYEFGAWVNSSKQYQVRRGVIKGQKSGENEWYIQCSVLTDEIPAGGVPHAVEINREFSLQ